MRLKEWRIRTAMRFGVGERIVHDWIKKGKVKIEMRAANCRVIFVNSPIPETRPITTKTGLSLKRLGCNEYQRQYRMRKAGNVVISDSEAPEVPSKNPTNQRPQNR